MFECNPIPNRLKQIWKKFEHHETFDVDFKIEGKLAEGANLTQTNL